MKPPLSQQLQDERRLEEIRKELGEMLKREQKRHMMDSNLNYEQALIGALEALDSYLDYDPTPEYLYDNSGGEPNMSAEELHSGTWNCHKQMYAEGAPVQLY